MTISIDQLTPSRRNRFTSVRLDRMVEYRDDSDWLDKELSSELTRLVPMWRSRCLMDKTEEGLDAIYIGPHQLDQLDTIQPPTLLGHDGSVTYFAVSINDRQRDELLSTRPTALFKDLRMAADHMKASDAGILAYAKALHYWQHRHRFCGVCGSPNLLENAGHKMVCTNDECSRETFPRIDPAIIVLVTQGDACLLGRNRNWPKGRFSTLAGFVEPGESLEDAVVREVYEEARVRLSSIHYCSSQPWPFPASAMCGFYAEAVNRECSSSDELDEVEWFTVEDLNRKLEAGSIKLSAPVSIAFRLLADWYWDQCGKDLQTVVEQIKSKAS